METMTVAGGCFWCIESTLQLQKGVVSAEVGFAGGSEEDADYDIVATGKTKHREAVQIKFDPEQTSYKTLIDNFWLQIDATDPEGQFADRGYQYTTAIYYHDENQKKIAEESKTEVDESGRFDAPVATAIEPFTTFFPAEQDQQDFFQKHPDYYKRYRKGSGREDFVNDMIDKVAKLKNEETEISKEEKLQELKEKDPDAYKVLAENATEAPFQNEYWDNKADGIYVDKVTGKPLFSSTHKYDSGSGWPSFYKVIKDDALEMKEDNSHFMHRTEIRSEGGHVGHVFGDGPKEKGGQRFCTNSASLRFIPKDEMVEKGYGDYLYLFEE